jgi:hypothetical protein
MCIWRGRLPMRLSLLALGKATRERAVEQIKLAIDLERTSKRSMNSNLGVAIDNERRHALIRLMAQAILAVHSRANDEQRQAAGQEGDDVQEE